MAGKHGKADACRSETTRWRSKYIAVCGKGGIDRRWAMGEITSADFGGGGVSGAWANGAPATRLTGGRRGGGGGVELLSRHIGNLLASSNITLARCGASGDQA